MLALDTFVREVRESRFQCDSISTELYSLNGALTLLRDDAAYLPPSLAEQISGALDTCITVVNELKGCVFVLNKPGVSRADKRSRWLASRNHMDNLRWTLGEYKLALGLAADLVGMYGRRNFCHLSYRSLANRSQNPLPGKF